MKKILLFLLLAGSLLAFGQEQKLVTVEARGMGADPEAATKDALSLSAEIDVDDFKDIKSFKLEINKD